MEIYYELKEMLCKELEDLVKKGELSTGSLDAVDKITHSIKSIVTIMAMEDGGYSNDGYSGRRDRMGRYSGRRYSRDEGRSYMSREVERLMDDAQTPEEREVLQRAHSQLQNMR